MRMESQIALDNLKYHKSKNILIGIAIFLTTLLLFLVPTLGHDLIDSQFAAIRKIYPSWYGSYMDIDSETVEKLSVYHGITEWGVRTDPGKLANDEYTISLLGMDEKGMELFNVQLLSGTLPQKENEIVVSQGILDIYGQKADIGDTIRLPYQIRRDNVLDYKEEADFVISGFLEDSEANYQLKAFTALISQEFVNREIPKEEQKFRFLFQVPTQNNDTTTDIEDQINSIAKQFGIKEENIKINNDFLIANYVDPQVVPGIIAIMLIIVVAGVITIYSIYYVGMSSRIQEFGRLKALGATKRQLKRIVLREGILVSFIVIPIGLLIGSISTKIIFQLMIEINMGTNVRANITAEMLRNNELNLLHPIYYLLTIVVTLLTVYISLLKPMRIASRVSEIEALRYQGDNKTKDSKRKSNFSLNVSKISKIYLMGNKKNTFVTIGAMSLTGIFVMIIATVLSCANPRESTNSAIIGQYEISNYIITGNREHPENEWRNVMKDNPLNDELKEQILEIDGVKSIDIFESIKTTASFMEDSWEEIGGVPEKYAKELIDNIYEGSISYEELKSGDFIILNDSMLHYYPDLKVGDCLHLQILDGSKDNYHDVTIAAIGKYTTALADGCNYLMAKEGTQKICPYNINSVYHIFAKEEYSESTAGKLQELASKNSLLRFESWKAKYDTWAEALSFTNGACWIFLAILGAICIMNMINTMIHSVHLRKKEIGMMQAIGMTNKQLTKMLSIEGLYYAAGTLLLSIGGGSIISYPLFLWAKSKSMFGITNYHYPFLSAIIVATILFGIQIVMSFGLGRSVKKESLIERIRYSE